MQSIILESPLIRLVVRPELGGRMTSLVDRRSGREWLWENPYLAPLLLGYGESYTEKLDGGGWDEILPSVSPCRLTDGSSVPDHGDIVHLPASLRTVSARSRISSLRISGLSPANGSPRPARWTASVSGIPMARPSS